MESVEVTSRKQTNAINQVYYSIMQISAVVQSNTATAKQSSTSSEELSSQANLLREEVKYL
jgi:methyl-accepting chemotaxis protein